MQIYKIIDSLTKELGIPLWGISNYTSFSKETLDWLKYRQDQLYATEFEEASLSKRLDKSISMPGAASIIVLGLSYNTGDYNLKVYPRGKLARIAYGQDYHQVLGEKIQELARAMEKEIDFSYQIHVDTGPLIERELAHQAGLGYYGKNSSIINPDYGSYICLGYMITNLDLKETGRMEDQCGSCRLCIDACPTGALMEPYRINPKKCISYLTQSKELDENLVGKMGIKAYGCDSCQEVCPKNKGVKKSLESKFIPHESQGYIDIVELMAMSNREFVEKYGSMSASWRGRNILKRNALIALENIGDKKFIELVEREIQNPSKLVSDRAKLALLKLRT